MTKRDEQGWLTRYMPNLGDLESKPDPIKPSDTAEAIEASIVKWTGLREENLAEFGIGQEDDFASDHSNARTCRLCVLFYDESAECDEVRHSPYYNSESGLPNPCAKCPLAKLRGGAPCDKTTDEFASVWHYWYNKYDPEPMIEALKLTLKKFNAGELDA